MERNRKEGNGQSIFFHLENLRNERRKKFLFGANLKNFSPYSERKIKEKYNIYHLYSHIIFSLFQYKDKII